MKKMLSILCVAGLALTLLAGCGNSSSSSSAASSEDTLGRFQRSGRLGGGFF